MNTEQSKISKYDHHLLLPVLQAVYFIAAYLLFNLLSGSIAWAQSEVIQGPVAAVGHGKLIAPDGEIITPTPEFIREAQNIYRRQLIERLPEEKKSDFNSRINKLIKQDTPEIDQVFVNSEVISTLINEASPANSANLLSINGMLQQKYWELVTDTQGGGGLNKKFEPSIKLQRALTKNKIGTSIAALTTTLGGQDYIEQCDKAGVPVPPDWGSPLWQKKGALGVNFLKDGTDDEADVYTYESTSPKGLCIALPRYKQGKNSSYVHGIICQGNDTSKSCFWDSRKFAGGIPFNGITPITSNLFVGGTDLVSNGQGVCTDCHAGENNFVVHPAPSPLALGDILKAAKRVDPVVSASWPQNQLSQASSTVPAECGGSCHSEAGKMGRFPLLSNKMGGYCSVLAKAIIETMPPGNPGSAKEVANAFRDKWCNKSLDVSSSEQTPCGNESERECLVGEHFPSCRSNTLVARNGMCVRLDCGREGERPCGLGERIPSCDSTDLFEIGGKCLPATACGNEDQPECPVGVTFPSCRSKNLKASGGICIHPPCGREGERPCGLNVRIPSCDDDLKENFLIGRCVR